jgi:hypothetical protein
LVPAGPARDHHELPVDPRGRGIIGDWNGTTVKLNTSAKVELGDRVTFAFSGVTDNGIPRCPSFVALRDYE